MTEPLDEDDDGPPFDPNDGPSPSPWGWDGSSDEDGWEG